MFDYIYMTLFVLLCVFECMRVAFFNCTILFQKILITKPEQSKPLAGKILGRINNSCWKKLKSKTEKWRRQIPQSSYILKYKYLVWFQQEKPPAKMIPLRKYFMYKTDGEGV